MLAKTEVVIGPTLLSVLELDLAFFDQVLPHDFRLLDRQRKAVHFAIHSISELLWKLFEGADLVDLLRPPVELLRRDVGSRWDGDIWVHEE